MNTNEPTINAAHYNQTPIGLELAPFQSMKVEAPETDECDEPIQVLEDLYFVAKRIAFYFVPEELVSEFLAACCRTERILRKYKSSKPK